MIFQHGYRTDEEIPIFLGGMIHDYFLLAPPRYVYASGNAT